MTSRAFLSLLLLGAASYSSLRAEPAASPNAGKRIVPGKIWLDTTGAVINAHGGGILFHDGLYYWFGEHKIAGPGGNSAQVGVHCYSSANLVDWKDEGIALAVQDQGEIERGGIIERPKVIYNAATGKFVMWFHLEFKGEGYKTARSGVAVADKVTGPYEYQGSFRPDDSMARDQTLFVDDDGKAYVLYASEENRTLHISQLTDDYLKPTGNFARVFVDRYMEAPAICKRDGVYYLIASGCSGWNPNAARSAKAESILGPWTETGNPCIGVNPANNMGPEKTFGCQSTFILSVQGKKDAYIVMFDLWKPENPINGRYVWLPAEFTEEGIKVQWRNDWDLSVFP